jgi:hypothetical protein
MQIITEKNFDLARRLTTNLEFKEKLGNRIARTFEYVGSVKDPLKQEQERQRAAAEIWRECGNNASLLVPWYFPKLIKNKPVDMWRRPFNMVLLYMMVYSHMTFRGSRQTGKSTTLGLFQRMYAHLIPGFRSIYVAPHQNPLETYSRKLLDIEKGFRYPVSASQYKQLMYYKDYPGSSKIELVRVQTSATPIRGKSADCYLADEIQLFDPGLELECHSVMDDSDIKYVLNAGTSTTSDSLLEHNYLEGCQATWHVLLDDGQTIDCGDPEQVLPAIGEYFMIDPRDGRRINPLRGFYRFNNPAAFAHRRFSIHIPQILNPDKAENPLEWNGIYRSMIRDKNKMIMEKLGIPVEESNREVTEGDLRRICVNPEGPDARMKRAQSRFYRMIVSAFDWGGSDYNPLTKTKVSRTFHSILGVRDDGYVDILHLRPHGGMRYTQILDLIALDHQRYRATAIASDFGGGTHYHELMRTHPAFDPSRHVIFDYTGPEGPLCQVPKTSQLTNLLMLNRTDSLTSLFMAIVMENPVLRAPSWDECGEYLLEFLNMSRALVESERGNKGKRFVYHNSATRPSDCPHSLNFGFSLIRLATQQALVEDNAARMLLRQAFYGGGAHQRPIADPLARALSNYARNNQDFD